MGHIYWEHRELLDDPRLREWLESDSAPASAGDCAPPMDVLETAAGIELLMDLPGVPRSALRVLFSQGTLIVAGRKLPASCRHREAAFHLAERGFGRFIRAVRLAGAFDTGNARASLTAGELRIFLPRIDDRRGREIRIDVTAS